MPADSIRPDVRSDASLPRALRNRASGLVGARATHGDEPRGVSTPAPRSPGSVLSSAGDAPQRAPVSVLATIGQALACLLIVALIALLLFVDGDVLVALFLGGCK